VNSPETPIFTKGRVLFGLDRSKRPMIEAGTAIVLEGQIDLISAFEHGVRNVVAPQGTAFTPEQARLLKRFVPQVILCFDSDTAGQNAVEKSLPALLAAGIEVRVATLPAGEDPDSLIRSGGVKAFEERVAASKDFFDHAIDRAAGREGGTPGTREKAAVAARIAGFLPLLPEAALREATETHVAARLGLSLGALREAGRTHRPEMPEGTEEQRPFLSEKVSASTELICRIALISPEARVWLLTHQDPPPWDLDPELSLLKELAPCIEHLDTPTPQAVLALLPERYQAMVSGWELEHLPPSPVDVVRDAMRNLTLKRLKGLQQEATLRLRTPGLSGTDLLGIQKEILDYQQRITDLTAPASQAPTPFR
jgi:DNA primase